MRPPFPYDVEYFIHTEISYHTSCVSPRCGFKHLVDLNNKIQSVGSSGKGFETSKTLCYHGNFYITVSLVMRHVSL